MRAAITDLFARAGLDPGDAPVQEEVLAILGPLARAQAEALERTMLGMAAPGDLARAFGATSPDPYQDLAPDLDTRT